MTNTKTDTSIAKPVMSMITVLLILLLASFLLGPSLWPAIAPVLHDLGAVVGSWFGAIGDGITGSVRWLAGLL